MANNEAGAFLNITPDVLKKLDSFDEKLEKIEKHAHTAADALKNGFGNVVADTTKLENAIASLTNKIASLNSAGNAVQNIGTSMNQVSKDATKAASSLSSVAQSINKVKPDNSLSKSVEEYRNISSQIEQISGKQKQLNDIIKSYELTMSRIQSGKGGVIQAGQQQQVQAARQEFEANNQLLITLRQKQQEIVNTNVAYQKQIQLVNQLKSYQQEQSNLPSQRSQQTLTDMRAYYSELEKSSARAAKVEEAARIKEEKERSKATEKAIKDAERKAAADEKAAQRAAKAASDLAKQQELAQRTTPQGALDYSKNAKSLQQNVQAIEYLKKARLSLNTTDKNYQATLQQINQAIARHNQALTEAGVKSQQLVTRHRNLMDTAGQLQRQLSLLFSVSQIEGYIKKLANVRGEFELQQRSLEAILQNKSQADQIFNKTVQLAIKSPFQIKELVTFTKQLAAYRIESGKLYDTTKRLADVSAGLGVDMGRLILAYGQVKAAAYLRGCLGYGTKIRTVNGIKEVQDIVIGDKLLNENNDIVNVIELIRGSEQMYIVHQSNGDDYRCNENHILTLYKDGELHDVYVKYFDSSYSGVRYEDGRLITYPISVEKENVDDYYGFVLDGNKRLQLGDGTITHNTEVRQFTEAGINLYGELQRYFQEIKGEAYTTAQIVDMISKRKVTFEDVENIFQRLTDKGGLFYNMQEIQAETLRGKINNLKDSIDVMLNSIGKANEDTLKGTIDGVRVLIENWEILAESLKGVAAILAIVKLQSILTSEKMLLMAIDMGVMTNSVQKSLTIWQLLRMGLIGVSNAFKVLSKAILSNIYLVTLAAIAYAVKQIYDNYAEYNKALEENSKKYNENISPINSLIAKYRELTEEANKAKAAQDKNFDAPKNRKDRENIVSQLIEKFKEYGIQENIGDISKLTDKELESALDRLNKKYRDLQNTILGFANAYAEVNNRSAWNPKNWQDRLDGDAKDLKKAGDEMAMYSSRVSQMLDIVGAHYFELSSKVAGYYNEVKKGPDTSKGESEVEWLLRALDALKKINAESQVVKKEFSIGGYSLFDITNSAKDFNTQKKEFENEIDKLKIELERKSIKDPILVSVALNQLAIDNEWDDLQKNIARKRLKLPLVTAITDNPNESGGDTDPKMQRDILAERISLIKELNKEYEKLNKVMGSDKAAKTVMERYASQLKDVKMPPNIIGKTFLPNKENTAKALQEFSNTISDFRKRIGAQKDANVLFDENVADSIKKQLDKTKKNIEDMFNGLDLHQKLKDAGLSEAEVQQLFPGLAKTLDDVQKGIEESYKKAFPKGEYLVEGTDANKQYKADQDKLNQQRIKEQQDLVIELTKAYKAQLSDQLQLDRWYYEERAKIAKSNLTEEQKIQYEANLKNQYNKKSDENTWKQFQNSDMYVSMFENIENSSTRMLKAMQDKLASLRENLKNLPADQLKAIINQQEKIDEMISQKNPFSGLTSGAKEYIQFLKQRKELEEENIRANNAVEYYTEQKNIQSQILQQKKKEYDAAVEAYGVNSEQANQLRIQLMLEKSKLDAILAQLVAEGKITEETAAQIRNGQKLGKTLSDKFSEIGRNLSEFSSGITDIASNLENVFGTMSAETADTVSSIAEIADGLGQAASGVGRIMSGDIIGGGIQALFGLTKTIGSIFAIGDKKKEREIQRQIKNVGKLQKAYDVLKEKMDIAWSSATLHDTTKQTTQNIDQQIKSYQAMIKAEQDKKKTDKDRIEEWNDAIKELEKTKQEILKQEQMDLGGIGGETEYKDAAQAFADAWVDAFNESEDGLKALQETFDDYITNLIKKQAMMRLVQARMKSVFEAIDKSVAEESAGGINLTKEELANIQSIGTSALKGLNEDLLALMETLGYTGTSAGKGTQLSALTQSIQSLNEQTAEELAAILESIRFFVNQQTSDVTAIKALLEARYGLESQSGESNPMLVELREQTGYLKNLSDIINSVFAPTANSKGAGIRVFMQ